MVSEHEKLDIGKAYYKDGIQEGIAMVAKAMLKYGLSPEVVSIISGLSEQEVSAINTQA